MKTIATLLQLAVLAAAQQSPPDQVPLTPKKLLTIDQIPLLGFGTWNLKSNCTEAVSWAIQAGYRHIDGAAAYGNENAVGLGIADGLAKAGLSRSDIWVTSKLWNNK
jgi:alcohol dehydrogenase (NADP+)